MKRLEINAYRKYFSVLISTPSGRVNVFDLAVFQSNGLKFSNLYLVGSSIGSSSIIYSDWKKKLEKLVLLFFHLFLRKIKLTLWLLCKLSRGWTKFSCITFLVSSLRILMAAKHRNRIWNEEKTVLFLQKKKFGKLQQFWK